MTLTYLIEALEKATGPDRELDARIAVAVDGFYELPPKWDGGPIGYGYTDAEGTPVHPGHGGDQLVRRYTASVDAAIALAERVLPGWCFDHIGQDYLSDSNGHGLKGMGWAVEIVDGMTRHQGQAKTFPIAILLAILSALQAKEGAK